jgi:tetratricopeptide (TPR) repeat protein
VHQIFLGWNLHELTRYEEAALRFRRAMAALESDRLAYGLAHARAQLGLADVLSHFGEYDTARDHALEALHAFTEDEPWHPDTGQLFVILAVIEKSAGNLDAAETYTRRAIAFESSGESRAYGIGPLAVRELGEIQLGQGECAAAERLMREQLETIEPLYPRGHASLLLARSLLGESLLCMGRYDDAREVLLRVDPTAAGFAFLDDEEQAAALDRLIRVHEALGRPDEAERYRRLARAAAAGLNASSSPQ